MARKYAAVTIIRPNADPRRPTLTAPPCILMLGQNSLIPTDLPMTVGDDTLRLSVGNFILIAGNDKSETVNIFLKNENMLTNSHCSTPFIYHSSYTCVIKVNSNNSIMR